MTELSAAQRDSYPTAVSTTVLSCEPMDDVFVQLAVLYAAGGVQPSDRWTGGVSVLDVAFDDPITLSEE